MHCNYSSTSESNHPQQDPTFFKQGLQEPSFCLTKMASNYEKEPIFLLERRWDDSTKLPEKNKFQCRNAKAEVCIDSGTLGMEIFLEKTLTQFNQAGTCIN